jgi:serine/threonine protein kinase, bacterial
LPFTGLNGPWGVAVDTAGIVYIADYQNSRVLKLPAQ